VKQRLTGLKVASYYGCQVVRPFATFDDPWKPTSMDRLVEALGGKPVKWPLKTRCCGGTLMGTISEVGLRLSHILLQDALRREADMMITLCPLCQFNLDCYQDEMTRQFKETIRLPVLYFTQLMGRAFGISDVELGIQRSFIQPTWACQAVA
jgi:heterodisulfide reductase subunit B